jgi:SAM-dependent methyltransferase
MNGRTSAVARKESPAPAGDPHLQSWEETFASRPWGRYPSEDLVRFMARRFGQLRDRSAVRVLEIGCGPGANLWFLGREGYAVAGIDGSPTAIRLASERLRSERISTEADLRTGDFASLPWPDASFDLVADIEALSANRSPTIEASIGEVLRVLKPGGVYFGKLFGLATTGAGTGAEIEPHGYARPTDGPCCGQDIAHFFDEPEVRRLFAGFDALHLDWTSRSDHGGRWTVFEWLLRAER